MGEIIDLHVQGRGHRGQIRGAPYGGPAGVSVRPERRFAGTGARIVPMPVPGKCSVRVTRGAPIERAVSAT